MDANVIDALVLGCGVSGLSTAILLQQQGRRVTIWAKDVPPHTTSNIAAAVWYPYRAFPVDRVLTWGAASPTSRPSRSRLFETGGICQTSIVARSAAGSSG